jgi:hypothetical protein
MGHYLSTSNPEAAERLQRDGDAAIVAPIAPAEPVAHEPAPIPNYDGPLPLRGDIVDYFARPGEGRAGKTEFAAIVLHVDARTSQCELLVFYGHEDFGHRIRIPRRNPDHTWLAWDFRPNSSAPAGDDPRLTRLLGMFKDIEQWAGKVFGENEAPEESLYDEVLKLGARLRTLEKSEAAAAVQEEIASMNRRLEVLEKTQSRARARE